MSIDALLVKRLPAIADSAAFELNTHLRTDAGITVLFGPSGAGKTLLLNCLAGFARPDEGRILVHDQLYFDASTGVNLRPQDRRCGYIFQDHALFPHMTVRENLRFAASSGREKTGRLNRHRKIHDLLETFELTELAERKPAQLSGGQKQRAAIARILMNEPRMLLLDEPARGLDARLRESFHDLLRRTRAELSIPIVLVTHDLEECFALADEVCLMERGRFLQTGSRDQVFQRPATAEVARSLGVYNTIPAEIEALDPGRNQSRFRVVDSVLCGPYLPGHLIGDRGYLCVRISEIRVANGNPCGANEVVMRITGHELSTHGVRVHLEHGVSVTVSNSEFIDLRDSETLRLHIPGEAVHFVAK
jgi:molybdate transport system ATP-binding protein